MECTYDAALYSNTVCKYVQRLSSQEHRAYQLLSLNRWNIKVNILKSYEIEFDILKSYETEFNILKSYETE